MPPKVESEVVRLKPYQYIHVHDNNTNVTRVVVGPTTFTKQDHEQVVSEPKPCVVVPPRHFVTILNPVVAVEGKVEVDKHGQAKVALGDRQIRFEQEPFPLFPQEEIEGRVEPLKVLQPGQALHLRALRDFEDHAAGAEWLFEGPGTYVPRVEAEIVNQIQAIVVKPNTGLLLRARNACKDRQGKARQAGEEWLYTQVGAYLPSIDEEIVETVNARILTDKAALSLECRRNFVDMFGQQRKAGEQWLVTHDMVETYIAGPSEKVVGEVRLTTLSNTQFCVVCDPWRDGKRQLGQKEVRRGRVHFFLQPGESLEQGIQNVFILGEDEALLLYAKEGWEDGGEKRRPGDRWMIYGPTEYVPPVAVDVLERRHTIPMTSNEGIYVRDTLTGQVRSVIGQTYMLTPYEELWAKPLSDKVLQLLSRQGTHHLDKGNKVKQRDATRVLTYSVPHNSVVQVYDYRSKKSRIVFGPDMVKLEPDEQFTVVELSGDKPKRAGVIQSLSIFLGPDFMTDLITVETSDHARLALQLSYNWVFDIKYGDSNDGARVFNVKDFVGDACSAIASRIRGSVASEPFDMFHKNSATIIRTAVFGLDRETGQPKSELVFPGNDLHITSVDIQSVEPVDQKTREALTKSVQLAIEITTKSQEAAARHTADTREQIAKGELERQIISDKAAAEENKKGLLQLQAESAAIESAGASKAEARANAASANIEGESAVQQAQLKAAAEAAVMDAELSATQLKQESELEFQMQMNLLEVEKAKQLAEIEVGKFKSSVSSIGKETIASMARAGPEAQVRMLKGLGLQGYLMTDGNSPINLMNTAQQLAGQK